MSKPPYEAPTITPMNAVPAEALVIFEATGDSAYRHGCGAMVTQNFHRAIPDVCSRCGRTT